MVTPFDTPASPALFKRAVAEAVGTALLLATIVGSGIMGTRLSAGNVAIALLANSLATGAGLTALILSFGWISGAHFNPVITLTEAFERSPTSIGSGRGHLRIMSSAEP